MSLCHHLASVVVVVDKFRCFFLWNYQSDRMQTWHDCSLQYCAQTDRWYLWSVKIHGRLTKNSLKTVFFRNNSKTVSCSEILEEQILFCIKRCAYAETFKTNWVTAPDTALLAFFACTTSSQKPFYRVQWKCSLGYPTQNVIVGIFDPWTNITTVTRKIT